MESFLDFLGNNSQIFTAVGAILESIVVIFNFERRWKKKRGGAGVMSAPPSFVRSFLWTINPINCFRKIK